jgi:eukaryotic-like serine/threonine-protein kinase
LGIRRFEENIFMLVNSTLSTAQWAMLQSAFERAMSAPADERQTILSALGQDDVQVAEALVGMLDAAERWRGRTGGARGHLVKQIIPDASLRPGDRLGLYRIVNEIGRGGMGRVYLGERADGRVEQNVAIKIIRPGELDNFTRDRFRLEREILAGFNHPNIARLFDAGETSGGEPYFVMEYVQGLSLTAYCNENRLDLRQRLNLFLSVCHAVRYAHSKLVLHRDIKPSNILIDEHGVPKLIDFGIAKPLTPLDANEAEVTATQRRFFSPLNAAPEQLRGERAGLACDVYQLGTVLYELLCGRPIFQFEGATPAQMEEHILRRVPSLPSAQPQPPDADNALAQQRSAADSTSLSRQLRGDLDEIVLLALRKEPDQRYASVEQLVEDIQRHLSDQPVQARGRHGWYLAARFAKRHWHALSVAGGLTVLIAAFVVTLIVQSQRLQLQRDRAVAEKQQSEEVTRFMVDVFKAADPGESLSREMAIGTVVDNARIKLQSGLKSAPLTRSRILLSLAEVYASIDDAAPAYSLAEEALHLYEQSGQSEPRELIDYLNRVWSIYANKSTQDDALVVIERAIALHDALGDPLATSWKTRLNRLKSRSVMEDRDACSAYDDLIQRLRAEPATSGEPFATAAVALSDCVHRPGRDLVKDTAMVSAGVAGLAKIHSADDSRLWLAQERLAKMFRARNNTAEALTIYENLAARREKLFGPDSERLAVLLVGIGALYGDLDLAKESEAAYLKALSILQRLHGERSHPGIAATLINLANINDDGKESHKLDAQGKKAEEYYVRALQVAENVFGADSGNLAAFRVSYGDFKLRHADAQLAKHLFTQANAVLDAHYGTGMRARARLASILLAEGNRAEAEKLIQECEAALKVESNIPAHTIDEVRAMRRALSSEEVANG